MDLIKKLRIPAKEKFDFDAIPCDASFGTNDREEAEKQTEENIRVMRELQFRLFFEGRQSLLVVLQAPDAAGQDGLIRKVLGRMNPQGCATDPCKKPTEIELSHDFLWRVHAVVPAAGQVAIFNRSQYEDVLVVRVHELVPKEVWSKRYALINSFEQLLHDAKTTIIKLYLHISLVEQLERFKDRLNDPSRHWKLNPGDYTERERWDDYREAYRDVFNKCNADHAPWYVIPANRKWYRDFAVSEIMRKTLEKMDPQLPPVTVDLEEMRRLYAAASAK